MDYEADGQQPAPEETPALNAEEASAQVDSEQSEATTDDDGLEDTAQPEEGRKPAKGVQKRLDELTKRYREAERREERLLALLERQGGVAPQEAAQAPVERDPQPNEAQFEDYDAYQRALTKWELRQELKAEQRQEQIAERRDRLFTAAKAKYEDFDEVVGDPSLKISDAMADLIFESRNGAELAYFLGNNPEESARIANLPPHRQGIEMARIEAKLSAPKPAPKDPPPPPPKTVNGITAGLSKDPASMTMAEYVQWRKQNP